ncbi:MAG: hypothetical protein ACOX8Q_05535 [Christensenellales bacterium]|jgi:hypothetical protein
MRNKVRCIFWALVVMLYVLALTACNQKAVIDATPHPANSDIPLPTENESQPTTTPMPTNEQPIDEDTKDADEAQQAAGIGGMRDRELIDYLLSKVPEAYQMVTEGGMSALVTGETTELEGVCRDIWLVTNLDGKFTREILYTISASGAIYEYDPLEDAWELCNTGRCVGTLQYGGRPTKLAYVKLDKVLSDGLVQFLVDEVLWVDDVSMPNGYAIDNEVEDWVLCTATLWTECYVWINIPDAGMERYQISLDNFIEELRGRQGAILADIVIDEGSVSSISERYTP